MKNFSRMAFKLLFVRKAFLRPFLQKIIRDLRDINIAWYIK
ncbi:hypothetical protein NEOC95_001057 [Neochlamydia sp. AcF95]|nr:hypothetical protein [Neochlamydia sp. AcF95]